jgi:hypothetical protein
MELKEFKFRIYTLREKIWDAELQKEKLSTNIKVLDIGIRDAWHKINEAEVHFLGFKKATPEGIKNLLSAEKAIDNIHKRLLK